MKKVCRIFDDLMFGNFTHGTRLGLSYKWFSFFLLKKEFILLVLYLVKGINVFSKVFFYLGNHYYANNNDNVAFYLCLRQNIYIHTSLKIRCTHESLKGNQRWEFNSNLFNFLH